MNKIILILLLIVVLYRDNIETKPIIDSNNPIFQDSLITAIALVESKMDSTAYLKKENAAGILQIRPVMVKDVNRILKLQGIRLEYTLDDRWSIEKSIEMFNIYTNYYTKLTNNKERIARRWNGGPSGHIKKSTIPYWNKVKKILESEWITTISSKNINIQ